MYEKHGFLVLITANILLTLVNRSFQYSLFTILKFNNPLVAVIISITILIVVLLFTIPFLRSLFDFELISFFQTLVCVAIGALSVLWIEALKYLRNTFV